MLRLTMEPAQRGGGEKASRAMTNGAEARENGAEGMRLVRPRALLLLAAAPEKGGPPARERAWRLLDLARRTHEVHLLVRMDGRVRYEHWRQLSRLTRQVTLVPGGLLGSGRRDIGRTAATWAALQPFDAVLCGDARLWPLLEGVAARVRFCDGRHDLGMLVDVLAPPVELAPRPMMNTPQRLAA